MTMFTNEPNGLHATGIEFFQAATRAAALRLELKGMKRRGRSVYSICKQVYGFTGSRAKVSELMDHLVAALIAEKEGTATGWQLRLLDAALPASAPPVIDTFGPQGPQEA